MRSDQTIISEITQEIKNALPDWYGPKASLLTEIPERRDREFTIFLRYSVINEQGKHIPLILKMPRDYWMTTLEEIIASSHLSSFTRDEAAILQKIEQAVAASSNPDLCAIHVLAYLEGYAVTVMEEIAFNTYKQTYLKRPTLFQTNAFRHIQSAGEWLKLFHDSFSQDRQNATDQLDVKSRTESLLAELENLLGAQPYSLAQMFNQKYAEIQSELHPLTTLHNDFHSSNIFINANGQIGGFDPNPGPPDSIYVDLARALTDCETQQSQVLSLGLFYSKSFIQQMKAAFLQGYAVELNQKILAFYSAVSVLQKWVWAAQVFADSKLSQIPGMEIPLQYLFQRYFLRLIESYLAF
jgi:hypothetical protein